MQKYNQVSFLLLLLNQLFITNSKSATNINFRF